VKRHRASPAAVLQPGDRTVRPMRLPASLLAASAALAALLGAGPSRAADVPPLGSMGALTVVQHRKQSGLQFNANHGFVRNTYYRAGLQHRGRPVLLPPGGTVGNRSEFLDVWLLPGARRPAALVADGRWVLVTEESDGLRTEVLGQGTAQSLHWLDGPQPGSAVSFGRVRTEPFTIQDTSLQGGRFMLLDGQWLLDLRELRARPVAAAAPAGYTLTDNPVLGLSPDGQALALLYQGEARSAVDALVIVTDTDSGGTQLLPLDWRACSGVDNLVASPSALARCFEWAPAAGKAPPQLRLKAAADAKPWRTDFQLGLRAPRGPQGDTVSRFELRPVKPGMLQAVNDALQAHCGCRFQPKPGDGSGVLHYIIATGTARMRYDATRQALVVESPEAGGRLWSQQLVRQFGDLIEERLAAGDLRAQLLPHGPQR
jgi:hypothetical protein